MKNLIVCSDGTWNRPEQDPKKDTPTNVLKFARGIAPKNKSGKKQVVFYDWGIGSYHEGVTGGAFGAGLEKNVMDGYRFLVHNYEPGDKIYLFGFSRGAYTVRSLSGLINNCGILKGEQAYRIEEAFDLYKNPRYKPKSDYSKNWRADNCLTDSQQIHFIGVWDTVGAMGLPFSFFGLIKDKHRFYDNKLGSNITYARHALALDEKRNDFEPTIWEPKDKVNLKQVWFAGVHSDLGGGYAVDSDDTTLADISKSWLIKEAEDKGLLFEDYAKDLQLNPLARIHKSYKGLMRFRGKYERSIPDPAHIPTTVHISVKERYEQSSYKNPAIEKYLKEYGEWPPIEQ